MTASTFLPLLVGKLRTMSDAVQPSDEALVEETLSGDDNAFSELIRRHKRRIFGTAARFARNDQQVDDIAQEVFIRAFKNLHNFRKDAPFEHWLARIAVSACYDFLRKERKHRDTAALDHIEFEVSDSSIDRAIAADRAREMVLWALAQLRPDEQLILTLCELEERTVREVAELTGWSEANVKVRAFRARQALKRLFDSHADL